MKGKPEKSRTRIWTGKIFAITIFFILFLFMLPAVLAPTCQAIPFVSNSGYVITMELKIEFTTMGSGDISFYFGTTEKNNLKITSPRDLNLGSRIYNEHPSFDVHEYIWENFFRGNQSSDLENINISRIIKGVLDPGGDIQLVSPNITFYTKSKDIGVQLSTGFDAGGGDSKREYTYLEFMHSNNLAKELSTNMANKYWQGLDYAWIHIEIDSTDPISMSFKDISLDHTRSRNGESYRLETTYTKFTADNNNVMIHASTLKSPSLLFYVLCATIILGYPILVLIWMKKKFLGKGRVIPVAAILISTMVWVGYFYPGFALYSIGGLSYYIYVGIFLLMVLSCLFINLSPTSKKGYETMKEEEEKIEEIPVVDIPLVNYVHTTVAVSESPDGRDQHQILGLNGGATVKEIKKAYLEKIKDYHPDKYQDSPERIKMAAEKEAALINQAYENLMEVHGERK